MSKIHEDTYLTKDEFINMISGLNFSHIKNAEIEFITAFEDNYEEKTTIPRGFKINID